MKQKIALPSIKILATDKISDNLSILTINNLVFEPLLKWKGGFPSSGLLANWQCSDDQRKWTFQIREGAVFHDGKACCPEDIFAVFTSLLHGEIGHNMKSPFNTYLQWWKWTKTSPTSFTMESEFPTADILDIFCDIYIKRRDSDGTWLGTGPYQISSFTETSLELTTSNSRSTVRSLELLAVDSAKERLYALKNGDVDIATELPTNSSQEKNSAKFDLEKTVQTLSVTGFLNGLQAPFSDSNARLAVNHAVDEKRIINEVLNGCGIPASTVVSPMHYAYPDQIRPIEYDVEKAKRLISKSAPGKKIVIAAPVIKPEFGDKIAEMIAEDLRKIGLEVSVDVTTDRTKYAQSVAAKQAGDIAIFDSSPYSTFRVLYEKISSNTRWSWWQGVEDVSLADQIQKAHLAGDPQIRYDAYQKCLISTNRDPQWLYLYHPVLITGYRDETRRMRVNPYGILEIEEGI